MSLGIAPRCVRRFAPLLIAMMSVSAATPVRAQMIDDGLMVNRGEVRVTTDYATDRWSEYWEGTQKRRNGNIGTLTTRSVNWTAGYGVTSGISLLASLPYVWTSANAGVLSGMRGAQDLTLAAKVRLLDTRVASRVMTRAMLVGGVGAPVSDYTPDFLPMSIGLGARRAFTRGTVYAQDKTGIFADASVGYQWRSRVVLDRAAYYTNGGLTLSDQVAMPDVVDYLASVGWQYRGLCLPLTVAWQRTLGGGDIRRQDMPFVSNRMDFTRLHARAMITLPNQTTTLNLGVMRTVHGRNVGRSTMLTGGVTYAFR